MPGSIEAGNIRQLYSLNDDYYIDKFWKTSTNSHFRKYKNLHLNETCVIMGTGGTLKDYEPLNDVIHIGVNNAILYDKITLDYLFVSDQSVVNRCNDAFYKYKPKKMKFLGMFLNHSFYNDYFGPVPKYKNEFDSSNIPYEIYNNVVTDKTNPENKWYWPLDLSTYLWGPANTTIEKALHFALYCGFKKLIIVGCDCTRPYNGLVENWKHFKFFIENYYPDVTVEVLNAKELKGVFKCYSN